jgi:exodeoxyribonuclease-5
MTKDMDYGYSITIHKSQGGTFDRVAIDLPDINSVKNEELRRRLIYVGLSRAKDVVYLSM